MSVSENYILGIPPFSSETLLDTGKTDLLEMDAFLRMFTTQLEYQDPLNPMQSYELASQLAQFSTVEQLTRANEYLDYASKYLSSINNAQALALVDRDVSGNTDVITVTGGVPVSLSYTLEEPGMVTINIYDLNGKMVRSIEVGSLEAGTYEIDWDGKDYYGNQVEDGDYKVEVQLVTQTGETKTVYPDVEGNVAGMKFLSGLPYLILDRETGLKMPFGFVEEIYSRESNSEESGAKNQNGV
ncbi:flagellar hook assembly protein FlgD [Thermodesulforhabdus norvegica]|uniref:Basal-body rod modification protein FlgD n=1 Tax=Thermodesulforhabdus norvegica TaxID=39841 RepID=A0A1I4R6V1_9BACT|nr:FlgD immunoglobulin-like domain containing protein [Thermodesulforhabdus norvegica]SFM47643.1 flagellar basal-body rod modification protein FlgD [Thermodesulforhabdus norvegica]